MATDDGFGRPRYYTLAHELLDTLPVLTGIKGVEWMHMVFENLFVLKSGLERDELARNIESAVSEPNFEFCLLDTPQMVFSFKNAETLDRIMAAMQPLGLMSENA